MDKIDDNTFRKDEILNEAISRIWEAEASPATAGEIAVDVALAYVVEWLEGRGDTEASEILEELAVE